MSIVRVHPEQCRDLLTEYDRNAADLRNSVSAMSPLVTEALGLLDQPGQHPLYGPLPALSAVANDVKDDRVDLSWRLDLILEGDAQPMGMSGKISFDSDNIAVDDPNVSLVDALIASGLSPAQAQEAKQAINAGADFNEAVDQQKQAEFDKNMANFRQMEAAAWTTSSESEANEEGWEFLWDKATDAWDQVPAKDFIIPALAAALLNGGSDDNQQQPDEDRGLVGDFKHNILDGNSVVGGLITGRPSPEAVAAIIENAPGVLNTLDNAGREIRSLNPANPEGAHLLLTDPKQFFDNQATFLGGAKDWAVDTTKIAAAVAIAGDPVLNAEFEKRTGRDLREEVGTALKGAAVLAVQDPDQFAAVVIDWEGLENDPIRWAGNQAPEIIIEVLTGGSATSAVGARRAANIAADAADAASSIPPPRVLPGAENIPPPRIPDPPKASGEVNTGTLSQTTPSVPGNHDEARAVAASNGVSQDSAIHLLDGEINRRGRAVGGHNRNSANIRILSEWVDPDSGLDTARIEIFDSSSSTWVEKHADTSLFPGDWSAARILQETQSAFGNSSQAGGNRWIGQSDSGQWITGYYRNQSSMGPGWSTAYPTGAPE